MMLKNIDGVRVMLISRPLVPQEYEDLSYLSVWVALMLGKVWGDGH